MSEGTPTDVPSDMSILDTKDINLLDFFRNLICLLKSFFFSHFLSGSLTDSCLVRMIRNCEQFLKNGQKNLRFFVTIQIPPFPMKSSWFPRHEIFGFSMRGVKKSRASATWNHLILIEEGGYLNSYEKSSIFSGKADFERSLLDEWRFDFFSVGSVLSVVKKS